MKKTLIIFALLLALPTAALAQDRLHASAVFEGKVVPKDRMVETIVKGEYIKDYGLTLFRSVRMDVNDTELERISSLILADSADALSKETEIAHNRLSYALIALSPEKSDRCFLCFQSKPSSNGLDTSVIVVYMEGDTTLTELKRLFTSK